MPIFFHVDYEGIATFSKRAGHGRAMHRAAVKYAMYKVAVFWHGVILPKHFQFGAKFAYKHQRRKRAYSRAKQELAAGATLYNPITHEVEKIDVVKGGKTDIAFRGISEDKAKRNKWITSNHGGFVIKMRVPRYIVQRRRGSYPNMKREISTITPDEAALMSKLFYRHYIRFLRQNRVKS